MNFRKWAVTLLAISLIAGILAAYKIFDIRSAAEADALAPEYSETVEAASAEWVSYTPSVRVLGVVVAPQQVELRNELAGRIQKVQFSSGEQVSKGQLLVQMDISEEKAQLNSAIARAKLARSTNARITSLLDSKVVSQEQFDQTVAELQIAEADIELLKATIEKKTLRAPFDAIAGIHQLEAGQYLEENAYLTTIIGIQDHVWVDFKLPQFYRALALGSKVSVGTMQGTPQADENTSNGAIALEAKIIARDSTISSDARSLQYRVRVNKGKSTLIPNAVVSVDVPVEQPREIIAVPTFSILHSSAGPYVYILDAEPDQQAHRARRQPVTLGAQQGNLTMIEAGLSAGDRIATAGAFKLDDGLLVFIKVQDTQNEVSKPEVLKAIATPALEQPVEMQN